MWREILRVLIFAVSQRSAKNKFPQIKISANIFLAKIYSRVNALFSNLNSLLKNTVLRNYNLSLSFRNKSVYNEVRVLHRVRTSYYCLKNMYFYCTYSIKTKKLSMLGTGYFLRIPKINLNKKNQSVLIVKISSRKTQKNRHFFVVLRR